MSDLDYDIQELFIEGWEAEDIAHRLSLPLARVCYPGIFWGCSGGFQPLRHSQQLTGNSISHTILT